MTARATDDTSAHSGVRMMPGMRFGPYTVDRFVGSGGMATIFEATHHLLERRVAIKVMHETRSSDPVAAERFLREARVLSRIRHPNVVEIFDVGVFEDRHYLVMEMLEGESLERVLQQRPTMDALQATSVLVPIAAALAAIHAQGLVHRDVKPDNVLLALDEDGRVVPKLVDFGLAKDLADEVRGPHHTIAGTPHYMSPEQARGSKDLDARVDQYGFGVMLYRVLTGHMPYDGPSLVELMRAIDRGQAVPPREHVPSIDPGLESIVLRAMHRSPASRHRSVRELGKALLEHANARVRREFGRELDEATGPVVLEPTFTAPAPAAPPTNGPRALEHAETVALHAVANEERPDLRGDVADARPASRQGIHEPLRIAAVAVVGIVLGVLLVLGFLRLGG